MSRQYVRQPNRGNHEYAAHVFLTWTRVPGNARGLHGAHVPSAEIADRVKPDWHLCGLCSRIIAAQTDVPESTDMGDIDNTFAPV